MNIDWLLKKIEKHIPESVQKKIPKNEKNQGKKRERESSPGDDKGSASKKTKDEEQINLKRLTDLVDEKYPTPS